MTLLLDSVVGHSSGSIPMIQFFVVEYSRDQVVWKY